jgi:hypothetical protein
VVQSLSLLWQVPSVLTPVQIPASESVENVATVIVDSSAAMAEQLVQKIKVQDLSVVVVSVCSLSCQGFAGSGLDPVGL